MRSCGSLCAAGAVITFHALGVRFCLPLLTLIYPLLARQLGMNGQIGSMLLALGAHELAHAAAAAWLGVELLEIRLMPFGGSARMENPYGLPGRKIIPVAAAGPAINLMLAVLFAALAQWRILSPASAASYVGINLILCLFNLLPALPLDGGRILFALLQRRFGEATALRICLGSGWLLASGLLAVAAWGIFRTGRWNLSLILAAVFIISSGRDERDALYRSQSQRLLLQHRGILPVRIYQCEANTSVRKALSLLRPKERCWFIIDQAKQPRFISDESILSHIIKNGAADAPLGGLILSIREEQTTAPMNQELRI